MKKSLLLLSGLAIAASASAQTLGVGYVTFPDGQQLYNYINQWNGGSGTITVNGSTWEDQNFFVSRVKPKTRYYNSLTQVYDFTQDDPAKTGDARWGNDKRVAFWVPINNAASGDITLNAIPDGKFDGEVFSMWSYIDHYGNWSSPWGFVPGGFADVAHKNGVAVSGVAGVPFGGISAGWSSAFTNLINRYRNNTDAIGKFLLYHGVDGLGYNSEWSGLSPKSSGLTAIHDGLKTYMADKNPLWEVLWYAGTNDSGSIAFDRGVGSGGGNTELFKSASMFLNYNWNSTSTMSSSISYAKSQNKSPMYIYAGMNMQGGEPKSGENYALLKDYQYGIGLWGAHSINMFWTDRNTKGSAPAVMQRTYINQLESWFTNSARNPAVHYPIQTVRNHRPYDGWAGFSSMMTARSAIAWKITDEPFITYFNLGNGTFFNYKGVRQTDNEWYNISTQDYLPTWRWWITTSYLEKYISKGDVKLAADFVWDDAYMGGSCLQIAGSTTEEYIHLFKTNLTGLTAKTCVTLHYKILEGKADIELMFGNNTKADGVRYLTVCNADKCEEITDACYNGDWYEFKSVIGSSVYGQVRNGLGVIGLRIKNAENLKLYIGELGLYEGLETTTATPAAPQITLAKVLSNNYKGVDGKIIWNMANSKAAGEPVYNSDVNTSLFRVWAQQQGEEPVNMGMTTSWAAIVYSAPMKVDGASKIRFGVSALSMDMRTESEIAWSDYYDPGSYMGTDNIQINKSIIKPNEKFEMSFVDPKHEDATWVLSDAQSGVEKWRGSGHTVECSGLAEIGPYTLTQTWGSTTKTYPRYVSISSEGVGALPEIYTLSVDGTSTDAISDGDISIDVNNAMTFSYTGRSADGSASRGIDLNEKWFGVNVGTLNLQARKSFSVAAWVKYNDLPTGRSNFITIEDREGSWPYNNWGYFWSRITDEGRFVHKNIDTAWGFRTGSGTEGQRLFYRYDDAKLDVNAWTHVCLVFEYNSSGKFRQKFYINGVQQKIGAWVDILKSTAEGKMGSTDGDWTQLEKCFSVATSYGTETYEPDYVNDNYPITSSDWIAFGGMASEITAVKGCVDDFQVWAKAMDANDVQLSMAGLDGNNLPADVVGYWDLESDPDSDNAFVGKAGANATNKSPKAYWYGLGTASGEGQGKRNWSTPPTFLSGCPFISGTAYPIVTTPTWDAQRAQVNGSGSDTEGSASISFPKTGEYAVKLSLANGHGEDVKTYPVIKVGTSAIEGIAADEEAAVSTYTIDKTIFLEFAADGDYRAMVYNTSGMLVADKSASIVAGQNMQINIGTAGVYMIKVLRDGKELRTLKVINK